MDYDKDELGVQEAKHGAILIEGYWYDPYTPEDAINATIYYRRDLEKLKALKLPKEIHERKRQELEAVWRARLQTRSNYRFREKDGTGKNGKTKYRCPADGPTPLMTCAKKPDVIDTRKGDRALLHVASDPDHTPRVCQNKHSTTFNPEDSGRHGQHYEYESEEWNNHYHHLRNNVESMNAFVKDHGRFAIAQPGRFRMRGATAKSILVVITIAAANVFKIRQFLEEEKERELDAEEGRPVAEARTRRQRKTPARARITHRQTKKRAGKPDAGRPKSPPLRT